MIESLPKESCILYAEKHKLPQWAHGYDEWKFSKDSLCYYLSRPSQVPEYYCFGDRMIYAHYGLDSYGIVWHGSYADHWNACGFGYDLGKAIRWVRQAKHKCLGFFLWQQSDKRKDEIEKALKSLKKKMKP